MSLYVVNSTTLPVRVVAFRVKDDDSIVILLTIGGSRSPRTPLLDITLRKDIHSKALVPGARDDMEVRIDNRAGVTVKWTKSEKGHRILIIAEVVN